MRRIFGFLALASVLLSSPVPALAQNVTPPAASDLVLISRHDANGVGTRGAVAIGNIYNGVGIGYSAGGGGTATQITSRTTAVTLNTYSGQITLFSAAGSATPASFTVNDSKVLATDTIEIVPSSSTNLYVVFITAVGAGSFQVTFYTTGGTATDAPTFNFTVIHAATS